MSWPSEPGSATGSAHWRVQVTGSEPGAGTAVPVTDDVRHAFVRLSGTAALFAPQIRG